MKSKLQRRVLSLLLAGVMVLATGCGNQNTGTTSNANDGVDSAVKGEDSAGDNTAMGRYVEKEIDLSESLEVEKEMKQLTDGSIVIVDAYKDFQVSKDNGITWEAQTPEALVKLWKQNFYIMDVKMAADGTLGIIYEDGEGSDDSQLHTKCEIVKPDGTEIVIDVPVTEEDMYLREIWMTDDERYFVTTFSENIYEVKEDGSSSLYLTMDIRPELIKFQGDLMLMDGYSYTEILIYDMAKKEYVKDDVLSEFIQEYYSNRDYNGSSWFDLYIFWGEDGVIYLAGNKGLHRHVLGGSAMEQLVDGNLSRLGSPKYGIVAMIALENQEFLALFRGGKLIRFTYDPNVPSVPNEILKVYSLTESSSFRQAVSAYQVLNPEVFVQYEVGVEDGSSVTREDALKKLNTQIMAGEGPDVLVLDNMPMDSYIDKGLLLDLSDFMETCKEDLFDNIVNAFEVNGGIYAVPAQVYLPTIVARQKYTSKMNNLEGIAEAIEDLRTDYPEKDVLGICSETGIMKQFAMAAAPAWKTENGEINYEAIKEFLTLTKRIYDAQMDGIEEKYVDYYNQIGEYLQTTYGENWEMNNMLYSTADLQYAGGFRQMAQGILSYPYGYASLCSVQKVKGLEDAEVIQMEGQSSNVFIPQTIIGISAASTRVDQAKDFLGMILGEEFQSTIGGFPINRAAFDNVFVPKTEYLQEDGLYGSVAMTDGNGLSASMNIYWVNEEQLNTIKGWMETLETPYVEDSVLEEAIFTEGTNYMQGSKSLDEAIDSIEQKVSIYMAE